MKTKSAIRIQHVIVYALGSDRPGIVAAITKVLFDTGCNIEDSSMTILRGEFAMLMIVAMAPTLNPEKLELLLTAAGRPLGMSVIVRPTAVQKRRLPRTACSTAVVSVYGGDRPGIVHLITSCLARRGVNITDVQTGIAGSLKTPVYLMMLEIALPSQRILSTLGAELRRIAASLGVTVSINPVEHTRL